MEHMHDQLVHHLQGELARRCRERASYSLRSFAKYLEVDPATLSKVLRGQRKFGRATMAKVWSRLDYRPIDQERAKRVEVGSNSEVPAEWQRVPSEYFDVIAHWEHYAILELLKVRGFRSDFKWIAKELGVTVHQVREAVARLERLGFIDIRSLPWRDLTDGTSTTTHFKDTLPALKKLQRTLIQQALWSLESTPFCDRDISSLTVAIDRSRLAEASERIKKFRRELSDFLSPETSRDQVYHLTIQLFPAKDRL